MSYVENARPFLTLHMGQAGVQIGNAIWELLCLEHNIQPDGLGKAECPSHGFYDAMFMRNSKGHFMPRAILVDTDPTCINEIRVGPYRDLFSTGQLMSDHIDAGMNYMRGRHDFANYLVPETVERFRWLAEKTDLTPAMFLMHSIGGGTGSGMATSCLEMLKSDYGSSLQVLDISVSQGLSGLQNSSELINSTLYQYESREFTDVAFNVTNSAMFNVCRSGLDRVNTSFAHVNRLLAMTFSNLTSMERFPGKLSCNLASICGNVLPFRQLKTPVLACAPFATADMIDKDRLNTLGVTSAVLEPDAQLTDVDLRRGKHMAGMLLFRGAAKPSDIEKVTATLRTKDRATFVDWAPPSFHTGLIELPPLAMPGSGIGDTLLSVTLISNSTAIASLFRGRSEAIRKLMKAGGCFLHRYNFASGRAKSERFADESNKVGNGSISNGEGVNAGHNSFDASALLTEACDYMDGMAEMYASELPPDRVKEKKADSQPESPAESHRRMAPGGQSYSQREAAVGVYEVKDSPGKRVHDEESPSSLQEAGPRAMTSKGAGRRHSSEYNDQYYVDQSSPGFEEGMYSEEGSQYHTECVQPFGGEQWEEQSQALGSESKKDPDTSSMTTPAWELSPAEGAPASTADSTVTHGPQESRTISQTYTASSEGRNTAKENKTPGAKGKKKKKEKCCQKRHEEGAAGEEQSSCCRPRNSKDKKATGQKRSHSQNHANSYSFQAGVSSSCESLRSASCFVPESRNNRLACGRWPDTESSSEFAGPACKPEPDHSSESVPIGEGFADILDIIRDCQPGPMPMVSNVRRMVQRYNHIFGARSDAHKQ